MIRCDAAYFDTRETLGCGQLFRFEETAGGFVVYAGRHRAAVRTDNGVTYIDPDDEAYFTRYFDLDADYAGIAAACARFPETAPFPVGAAKIRFCERRTTAGQGLAPAVGR